MIPGFNGCLITDLTYSAPYLPATANQSTLPTEGSFMWIKRGKRQIKPTQFGTTCVTNNIFFLLLVHCFLVSPLFRPILFTLCFLQRIPWVPQIDCGAKVDISRCLIYKTQNINLLRASNPHFVFVRSEKACPDHIRAVRRIICIPSCSHVGPEWKSSVENECPGGS